MVRFIPVVHRHQHRNWWGGNVRINGQPNSLRQSSNGPSMARLSMKIEGHRFASLCPPSDMIGLRGHHWNYKSHSSALVGRLRVYFTNYNPQPMQVKYILKSLVLMVPEIRKLYNERNYYKKELGKRSEE